MTNPTRYSKPDIAHMKPLKKKRGRPRSLDPRSEGILVRVTPDQMTALVRYIENLNQQRQLANLSHITLAAWARAVLLRAAHLDHMGAPAEAERLIQSAQLL